MPRAPEVSPTERVYVAATKARPATEEPVKRTAAKSPAAGAKAIGGQVRQWLRHHRKTGHQDSSKGRGQDGNAGH